MIDQALKRLSLKLLTLDLLEPIRRRRAIRHLDKLNVSSVQTRVGASKGKCATGSTVNLLGSVDITLEIKTKHGRGQHALVIEYLPEWRGTEGREWLEPQTHDTRHVVRK